MKNKKITEEKKEKKLLTLLLSLLLSFSQCPIFDIFPKSREEQEKNEIFQIS